MAVLQYLINHDDIPVNFHSDPENLGPISVESLGPVDAQDVIAHFLASLLTHTKKQLGRNFNEDSPVRFVLTVPTVWSPLASQVLADSLKAAIKETSFTKLKQDCIVDLAIIYESEAAANFIVASENRTKDAADSNRKIQVCVANCVI